MRCKGRRGTRARNGRHVLQCEVGRRPGWVSARRGDGAFRRYGGWANAATAARPSGASRQTVAQRFPSPPRSPLSFRLPFQFPAHAERRGGAPWQPLRAWPFLVPVRTHQPRGVDMRRGKGERGRRSGGTLFLAPRAPGAAEAAPGDRKACEKSPPPPRWVAFARRKTARMDAPDAKPRKSGRHDAKGAGTAKAGVRARKARADGSLLALRAGC
jgi:hypothetical protein